MSLHGSFFRFRMRSAVKKIILPALFCVRYVFEVLLPLPLAPKSCACCGAFSFESAQHIHIEIDEQLHLLNFSMLLLLLLCMFFIRNETYYIIVHMYSHPSTSSQTRLFPDRNATLILQLVLFAESRYFAKRHLVGVETTLCRQDKL